MKYTLNTVLDFGKHRGKTVNQVLNEAPSYLRWCVSKLERFEVSEELRTKILNTAYEEDSNKYEDYYGAIDTYDYCD